jgi:hypothetical protein
VNPSDDSTRMYGAGLHVLHVQSTVLSSNYDLRLYGAGIYVLSTELRSNYDETVDGIALYAKIFRF